MYYKLRFLLSLTEFSCFRCLSVEVLLALSSVTLRCSVINFSWLFWVTDFEWIFYFARWIVECGDVWIGWKDLLGRSCCYIRIPRLYVVLAKLLKWNDACFVGGTRMPDNETTLSIIHSCKEKSVKKIKKGEKSCYMYYYVVVDVSLKVIIVTSQLST